MPKPISEKEVLEAINARRSVRSYSRQTVSAAAIDGLLQAAVRAPTAMHQEPWGFVVIQDKKLLQNLGAKAKLNFIQHVLQNYSKESAQIAETFSRPDFNIFYGASTLIIVCAKDNGHFVTADCWLAAENMMLAAYAMGLGTCVIGSSVDTLNMAEVKAEVGIPEGYTAIVPLIVGYPSGETPVSSRNKPSVLAWLKDEGENRS
jgi:nitroreductase